MRSPFTTARLVLFCVFCISACKAEYPEGRFACTTEADCPSGWVCEQRAVDTGLRCFRPARDAGAPDGCADARACMTPCTADEDCSNGAYCDGEERCDPSHTEADVFGCVAASAAPSCDDGVACTLDDCSDSLGRCTHTPPDGDDDGHTDATCLDDQGNALGDDCDDDNAGRHPGNPEVCDDNAVDEDCDPTTIGFKDDDGDGSIDAMCCNANADGAMQCGLDCDDEDLAVHAFQPEFCDGIDNDCDDETDEVENALPWYADEDMDGFGAGDPVVTSCTPQPGRSLLDNDCDDDNAQIIPRQPEACDNADNNCNGVADERLLSCETSPDPDDALPVNECVNGLSDCAAIARCRDTATAFTCRCPDGYTGEGHGEDGCADVNECLTDNGGCDSAPSATCENQIGMPRTCVCPEPYAGTGIGPSGCVEGNPCDVNNGGCDGESMATCRWTAGTLPTCECPPFYANAPGDNSRCVDINECDVNNGGCGSSQFYRCINNIGAAPTCEPLDVCDIDNGGCDTSPMAACDQNGTTITCQCPSGTYGNGMGSGGCTACTAIANCTSGLTCTTANDQRCGSCGPGRVGDGTSSCTLCPAGTFESGNACVDCGTIGSCAVNETCNVNNGGNLICPMCNAGYSGSGSPECNDINECLADNGGCDTSPMATCFNSPGSRVCDCPGDYVGTGIGANGCNGIQRGAAPTTQSASASGPYITANYTSGYRNGPDFAGATIYHPTNANPPFAMAVIVPGFTATQSSIATWGPFLASHGIVIMTIDTNTSSDAVPLRAAALMDALVSLRGEHTRVGSPLNGQLDLERTAVLGWSMGGGGAWVASSTTPELRASISLCGTLSGSALDAADITVPTLLFAGSADSSILGLGQSQPVYADIPNTTSKMIFEVAGGDHYVANNPANQSGSIGRYALSWLKVFLEGDERYRPLLLATPANASLFSHNLD